MPVIIRQQIRKSLAFQITPSGMVALIPYTLDPDSDIVQQFIDQALDNLPARELVADSLTAEQVHAMVGRWSEKLGVKVTRTQIRRMRNKWGSISTAGTLTLSGDLLDLPVDLVEYVVVHELLHLKFPDHRKGWRVSMGMYLPDWRGREDRLQAYVTR
jgi:YgjP-like, metallopeptidase domain